MYPIVSIVVFVVLGIIWTKNDLHNLAIKLGFFAMAVWGFVWLNPNVLTLTVSG